MAIRISSCCGAPTEWSPTMLADICTKCDERDVPKPSPASEEWVGEFDKKFEFHDLGKSEFTFCVNGEKGCFYGSSFAVQDYDEKKAKNYIKEIKSFISSLLSRERAEAKIDTEIRLGKEHGENIVKLTALARTQSQKELLGKIEKWAIENGITHKQSFVALLNFLKALLTELKTLE